MSHARHYVTCAEALAMRRDLDHPAASFRAALGLNRVAAPHYARATGHASCRGCGHKIAKGERAVLFDFYPTSRVWAAREAWLHVEPCGAGPFGPDNIETVAPGSALARRREVMA